jgi:hypothetical protein
MSGDDLPITGTNAMVTLSLFGLGSVAVPMPILIAMIGVLVVAGGALLVRYGWRRGAAIG